jgi:hypothetical protein
MSEQTSSDKIEFIREVARFGANRLIVTIPANLHPDIVLGVRYKITLQSLGTMPPKNHAN